MVWITFICEILTMKILVSYSTVKYTCHEKFRVYGIPLHASDYLDNNQATKYNYTWTPVLTMYLTPFYSILQFQSISRDTYMSPQTIFVSNPTVPSNLIVNATGILIRWHCSDNGTVVHMLK